MRKVMFTTYVSWWKRRWRAEVPSDDLPERPEELDAYAAADLQLAVRTALAGLPRRQRAVVVLRYFEDLTEAKTAEVLGCSVGTVKSQNAKAMASLRRSPTLKTLFEKEVA